MKFLLTEIWGLFFCKKKKKKKKKNPLNMIFLYIYVLDRLLKMWMDF